MLVAVYKFFPLPLFWYKAERQNVLKEKYSELCKVPLYTKKILIINMKIIELLYNEFKDGAPTLSEFVEWLGGNSQLALVTELRKSQNWDMSCKYNNFLKQPLTLGMFIPVDEDRDLLKKPKNYEDWTKLKLGVHYDQDLSKYSEYQKAEEKVMFSGFKYEGKDDDFIYVLDTNINERLFWNIKEGKIDSDDPEKQFVSFLIGLPVTKNYFKHLD